MTGEAWIDTVRLARDFGGIGTLLPPGVKGLWDMPYCLVRPIRFALMVMSWDQLDDHERPPRRIWHDGKALREWMASMDRERRRDADPDKRIDDPVQNPAVKDLIHG